MALAWLYRDDYVRAGFRMLPAQDATGHLTSAVVILYTLVLVPLTLMPTVIGSAGSIYGAGALLLGVGLLLAGVGLERQRNSEAARRLFRSTVIYLPVLLALLVLDRPGLIGRGRTSAPPIAAQANSQGGGSSRSGA
jgi:protoheme IX farnesyltransferase